MMVEEERGGTIVVEDLPRLVQRAREAALLGDYERSEELFAEAIELTDKQTKKCAKDKDARVEEAKVRATRQAVEKWKKVGKVLKKELKVVRATQQMWTVGKPKSKVSSSSFDDHTQQWQQQQQNGSAAQPNQSPPSLSPKNVPVWKQNRASTERKPRVPVQAGRRSSSNSNSSNSKPARTRDPGRRQAVNGNQKKDNNVSPYVEANEGSPDIELIKSIESTMLTHNLNVKSEDIAGLQGAKTVLEEAVLYPQLMPSYYTGIRRPWKGVLLFGPPGTGKTMLAKAIASECRTCFFNVNSSSLASKWRGESEKMVNILFDMARFYAPSTIFFDEIDSIASARGGASEHEASRRVKSELLTQMDGVSNDNDKTVVVLAATNLPWDLDDAIRRRLEKRIYIPLPDREGRIGLFGIATKGLKLKDDVDFSELAAETEGYSGADITNVCHEASMMPIRRIIEQAKQDVAARGGGRREMHDKMKELGENQPSSPPVSHQDFLEALQKVQSSVGNRDLDKYQKWLDEYGAL